MLLFLVNIIWRYYRCISENQTLFKEERACECLFLFYALYSCLRSVRGGLYNSPDSHQLTVWYFPGAFPYGLEPASFALRKVAYCNAKGNLLKPERWPFGRREVTVTNRNIRCMSCDMYNNDILTWARWIIQTTPSPPLKKEGTLCRHRMQTFVL